MITEDAMKALAPKEKPYRLPLGEGLFVQVQPNGTRLWRMAYRHQGKQKNLALGVYPTVSVRAALKAHERARTLLDMKIDPADEKRRVREERAAVLSGAPETFEQVARRWFATKADSVAPSYSSRIWSRIEGDILPAIGALPVAEIEPPVLLAAIREIEARGAVTLAKRVKNYCGEVFRFAIAEGKARRDPSADIRDALRKAPVKKHRAALRAADLPRFFAALDRYDGEPLTRLAVLLVVYTFVRTHEIRFARWQEFDALDQPSALWRIPADRMKMRREHIVPLAPQVVEIVRQVRALGLKGDYLFPEATRSGVISENRMIYALYRMGHHGRATIHGFRGTASTILNESNRFESDWIEMQLAHVQGGVRGAYNAAQWMPARRQMMQWYADFLDEQRAVGALL